MKKNYVSIQQKLMSTILLTSTAVLVITCVTSFVYEYVTLRRALVEEIAVLAKITAKDSKTVLLSDTPEEAFEMLTTLAVNSEIVSACLYNENNHLFSHYPPTLGAGDFPEHPKQGYYFKNEHLDYFEPVLQGQKQLGTLFIKVRLTKLTERLQLLTVLSLTVVLLTFIVSYFIAQRLNRQIAKPLLELAETAHVVSRDNNYTVRARKFNDDEIGELTEAFNYMLQHIERQNQEIHGFSYQLEQKVAERTRELEVTNKELASANYDLEAFSYTVSHDLRSPLRFILIYANKILSNEAELQPEALQLVKNILSRAERMDELIRDLLVFSQLNRNDLVKRQVVMKDIVDEVFEELKKGDEHRKITLTVDPLPPVFADPSTLHQVWNNLISNALKYSRLKEETVIHIGAYEEPEGIIYFIRDNGSGFDMKYYDKLFGVFQRLHTNKEFEGTGVGLAIVERVISKHGGRIWAESEVGKGSVFYFMLPK